MDYHSALHESFVELKGSGSSQRFLGEIEKEPCLPGPCGWLHFGLEAHSLELVYQDLERYHRRQVILGSFLEAVSIDHWRLVGPMSVN